MTDEHACKCQEPSAEDFERLAKLPMLDFFYELDHGGERLHAVCQIALREAAERRKGVDTADTPEPDAGREEAIEAAFNAFVLADTDDMLEAMRPAITAYEAHRGGGAVRYRHKRRGTEYELIGCGNMQSKHWRDPATPADNCPHGTSVNLREVAIYRSLNEGELWVRPLEEFEDGRFEEVKP